MTRADKPIVQIDDMRQKIRGFCASLVPQIARSVLSVAANAGAGGYSFEVWRSTGLTPALLIATFNATVALYVIWRFLWREVFMWLSMRYALRQLDAQAASMRKGPP